VNWQASWKMPPRAQQKEPAELLEEAVKQYLENRSWMKLMGYGRQRAKALGINTEENIDRLIAESRSEQRARIVMDNEALRSVRSSDCI
jgi:hypothetical protein